MSLLDVVDVLGVLGIIDVCSVCSLGAFDWLYVGVHYALHVHVTS